MKEGKIQLDVGAVNQPRTLFKPASWLAKIDFINHLILFNNVLITVLSETAGGKTSFSTLLQNNLDPQIKPVALTVKAPCDIDHINNEIATQLHLNMDANTDVATLVAQINERKAHILLIIDDAQHLPESFIKEMMVAIKRQEDFGFFHLCLVSDYSLVATLNGLAVEQFNNLIHTIELGSLNESETRTYVLQRAMAARLINRPLSDVQFKQFYQATKGSVSKINSSLESFIYNCTTQTRQNKIFSLKKVSAAVAATVVAGFSYMYFDSMHKYAPTEQLSPKIAAEITAALDNMKFELTQDVAANSHIASWQDSATHEMVQAELAAPQILAEADNINADANTTVDVNTSSLAEAVASLPTSEASQAVQMSAVKAATAVPESQLAAVKIPEVKLPAVKDEANLSNNPAANEPLTLGNKSVSGKYTIQLLASHNMKDINRFRKNGHLDKMTKVRQFKNEKGEWYVLTMGEFDTVVSAQSKIKTLPAPLAKLNPWVRKTDRLINIG